MYENISGANLLLVTVVYHEVEGIIGMKIFCANLLLVTFVDNEV